MTKLTAQAAGTFAIAPTPFHDDGRIDEKSIDRLTDFYAEVGCDGVTVLGILGEAPKLDAAEAEQVAVRFVGFPNKLGITDFDFVSFFWLKLGLVRHLLLA